MVISGVIRPPPEIRAVADKTALFVAKNGRAFEQRILNSEKGKTPKFAFLHSTSPFNSYYEQRIRFYEEGGTDEDDDKKQAEEEEKKDETEKPKASQLDKAQKASAIDPVAKALLKQRNKIQAARAAMEEQAKQENGPLSDGIAPPPALQWVSAVAPNIAPVQLETIKVVAQFVALDGKGGPLLQDLALREWSNPTFAFLQPRHGHFAYFSSLVDGYRHILSTWSRPKDNGLPTDVDQCLEISAYRAEYDRDKEERERAANEENGDVLSGAALIHWHDFVVVETIEFPVEEVVRALPPPPASVAASNEQDIGAMEESDEEEAETIRVVPSYKPKVVSTQAIATKSSRTHMIDPITGKSVPVADMPEHMRIQLMDPKWAEEKKKFMDKQKESNLVSGVDIAENINRMTKARAGDSAISSTQAGAKRALEEVSQQPQLPPPGPALHSMQPPAVSGASLPPPPPPFPGGALPTATAGLPPAKRPRVDGGTPNPPFPPTPAGVIPPSPPAIMQQPPPPPPPEAPPEIPTTNEPLSEEDFCASLASPTVSLTIQIPNDPSNASWNFSGQSVSLSVDVMSKVKAVKTELQSHLGGMPINKMQLKDEMTGFLKDGMTLASLNIGPTASLELMPKTRGRRK